MKLNTGIISFYEFKLIYKARLIHAGGILKILIQYCIGILFYLI